MLLNFSVSNNLSIFNKTGNSIYTGFGIVIAVFRVVT
jgi:hypothetical protein